MPIHYQENQYRGINAHLHSFFQERGGWETFHSDHIAELRRAISRILPSGYFALSEKSLQISGFNPVTGESRHGIIRPDVEIYRTPSTPSGSDSALMALDPPADVVSIAETLSDVEHLMSIVIYKQRIDDQLIPVTRIELLSPANKPLGSHYETYILKRDETLIGGVNLIEMDYLHQSPPSIKILPSYPERHPKAFPYTILVSHPYPTLETGQVAIYGFNVDDPIPKISVPLAGTDSIGLDLGAIYHRTFADNGYYGLRVVDYEQEPTRMESYNEADQERIRQRMAAVLAQDS